MEDKWVVNALEKEGFHLEIKIRKKLRDAGIETSQTRYFEKSSDGYISRDLDIFFSEQKRFYKNNIIFDSVKLPDQLKEEFIEYPGIDIRESSIEEFATYPEIDIREYDSENLKIMQFRHMEHSLKEKLVKKVKSVAINPDGVKINSIVSVLQFPIIGQVKKWSDYKICFYEVDEQLDYCRIPFPNFLGKLIFSTTFTGGYIEFTKFVNEFGPISLSKELSLLKPTFAPKAGTRNDVVQIGYQGSGNGLIYDVSNELASACEWFHGRAINYFEIPHNIEFIINGCFPIIFTDAKILKIGDDKSAPCETGYFIYLVAYPDLDKIPLTTRKYHNDDIYYLPILVVNLDSVGSSARIIKKIIDVVSKEVENSSEEDIREEFDNHKYINERLAKEKAAREELRIHQQVFNTENLHMDTYEAGQVVSQGPNTNIQIRDINFNQIWNKISDRTNLSEVASELAVLKVKLKDRSTEPEHHVSMEEVALAEDSAKKGDGAKTLEHLAKVGKWGLDIAKEIGTKIVAEMIIQAMGLQRLPQIEK
jgi:hypothetical protein